MNKLFLLSLFILTACIQDNTKVPPIEICVGQCAINEFKEKFQIGDCLKIIVGEFEETQQNYIYRILKVGQKEVLLQEIKSKVKVNGDMWALNKTEKVSCEKSN